MSSRKGLLFVFIAAVLFSIGGLCVKVIPWNGMAINSFRNIVSVVLLLIFAKVTGRKFKLTPGVIMGAVSMCGVTTLTPSPTSSPPPPTPSFSNSLPRSS